MTDVIVVDSWEWTVTGGFMDYTEVVLRCVVRDLGTFTSRVSDAEKTLTEASRKGLKIAVQVMDYRNERVRVSGRPDLLDEGPRELRMFERPRELLFVLRYLEYEPPA